MDYKKITSYLLYAIGEIVLVVIGILIAIGINDWSQRLKNNRMEERYLSPKKNFKPISLLLTVII